MNLKGVLLGGVAMLLWVASAIAQPAPLSQNTITAAAPLQQGQIAEVRNYVSQYVGQLVGDDLHQAAAARRQLFIPLSGSGAQPTGNFLQVYGTELASAVANVSANDALAEKPVARMNTMLVLARVPSDAAVPLQLASLLDKLDAVRYWAAKGLRMWAEGNPTDETTINSVINALNISTRAEANADVLTQQLLTLINLGTRATSATVMSILKTRLQAQTNDPTLSLAPVIESLQTQQKILIRKDVQNPGSVSAEFYELAVVAAEAFDFGSRAIVSREYDTRRNDILNLLKASDAALRAAFAAAKVDPAIQGSFVSVLNTPANWGTLRTMADGWRIAVNKLPKPAAD